MSNKLSAELYKDKIIHFIGGIHEYVGTIEFFFDENGVQQEHPNGPNWIRLNNPCRYRLEPADKEGFVKERLFRIQRDDKAYEPHVDIYSPIDSLKEIIILEEEGSLFKLYNNELSRQGYDRLVPASQADIHNFNPNRTIIGKKKRKH